MSDVLRKFVRRILAEELTSITRANGDKEAWDIEWQGDKIKNARKIIDNNGKIAFNAIQFEGTVDQEKIMAAQKAGEKFSTAAPSTILAKIIEVENAPDSPHVRADWTGIEDALRIVRQFWADSTGWPKPDRTGRGEATMNMAFNSIISSEEPDFRVAKDEAYSIKHFMNKQASAKNKGTPSKAILDALVDLAIAMKSDVYLASHGEENIEPTRQNVFGLFAKLAKITGRLTGGGMQPVDFQQYLEDESVSDISIPAVRSALTSLKTALLSDHVEHGSKGMIVFRGWKEGSADLVDFLSSNKSDATSSSNKLKIKAIRSDSRIEFSLADATTTYENVLDGHKNTKSYEKLRRGGKKVKAAPKAPNEKDFDNFVGDITTESRRRKVRIFRRKQ